jgi:glyoxylase-like metal-dependent hydrolase (beta-lactamase superfamily II)
MSAARSNPDDRYGHEIAPGVHIIGPKKRAFTKGGYSRAYLFEDGHDLTLADTGWDDDANTIVRYLDSIGRSPSEIRHIALTHAHRSHLGGLKTLASLSGAKVWCHEAEAPIVEGRKKAHAVHLWPLRPFKLIPFRILSRFNIPKHVPCKVNMRLVNGDRVGPLEAFHTPGHTEGHFIFRYHHSSAFAVGDAVATWPKFGPGWPGFNRDDKEYRRSFAKLVDLKPEVVGPGHGDEPGKDTLARLTKIRNGPKFRDVPPTVTTE